MICARCDKPILPGQPYEAFDRVSASAGGLTIHVHKQLCKRAQQQTAPVIPRH